MTIASTNMPLPNGPGQSANWAVDQVETLDALMSIEAEWRALEAHAGYPSLFSSFDFVRLAWIHSNRPGDALLVLVIREFGRMVAVAPFRRSSIKQRHIPIRVVEWLAAWEGERPDLLCGGSHAPYWARIERFFAEEYRQWDLIRLCERAEAIDSNGALANTSWIDTTTDSVGYFISLSSSFDEYLNAIDAKVKSNWRNRSRKIAALSPTPVVRCVDNPALMVETVDRFIAIERKSWKADAGLGMGKNERHRQFYAELACILASRGLAAFYFLFQGDRDIAGSLLFKYGDIIYERHIAHDPEFSPLSPGIVLRTEIMKDLFGKQWAKFDLMGMHPSVGRQRHKADWATGEWTSLVQHCYRRFGRAMPIIAARSVRRWLRAIPATEETATS